METYVVHPITEGQRRSTNSYWEKCVTNAIHMIFYGIFSISPIEYCFYLLLKVLHPFYLIVHDRSTT